MMLTPVLTNELDYIRRDGSMRHLVRRAARAEERRRKAALVLLLAGAAVAIVQVLRDSIL